MPEPITRITVLLASPGDVGRERGAVRRAAEEVNRVTGEAEGFHLTVKGWETHTRPAAGRPQGNVNAQIGPCDLFVGIMWARLGTPTGEAASGTVEEYERARRAWARRRKHKPSVMFYFRTSGPRDLRDIDPDQLRAVQAFRARVMRDDLAREYATVAEFERLIRAHLTAEARALLKRLPAARRPGRTARAPAEAKAVPLGRARPPT